MTRNILGYSLLCERREKWRESFRTRNLISVFLSIWFGKYLNNYPPQGRWRAVDIYRDAKHRGIYPPLFTSPSGDSCILLYIRLNLKNLIVESIQSVHNSLWTWHDKCIICCRYYNYHVKFNVCLVTKPLGVFSSETKWLNASLLFLRMNYVKNV